MRRSLLVTAIGLALTAIMPAAWANQTLTQEESLDFSFTVNPTFVYLAPNYLLGAELKFGRVTFPIVYGDDTLWISFESAPVGKFWTVGAIIEGLAANNPAFDLAIGLGYDWGGALRAMGCLTSSGDYFLAFGFTMTVW